MAAALKLKSLVLPGNRVEFIAPELPEGAEIDITISVCEPPRRTSRSVLDIIKARHPSRLSDEEWRRIERDLQEDRDSWDR